VPWPAALGRRRLRGVPLRSPAARCAQTIERALDPGDHSCRHAGVAGRRLELVVTEQCLNQANVGAALEQMGREAMTERVERERLAQSPVFGRFLEQPAELTRGQRPMLAATGKQPAVFRRDAGIMPGRPHLPPLPQQVEDSAGSITLRSLRPFDCTMRMIICALSMSPARSRTSSPARSPQPQASVSIACALRLVAIVRTRLISSGLSTGGSFCGSLMCQTSAASRGGAA